MLSLISGLVESKSAERLRSMRLVPPRPGAFLKTTGRVRCKIFHHAGRARLFETGQERNGREWIGLERTGTAETERNELERSGKERSGRNDANKLDADNRNRREVKRKVNSIEVRLQLSHDRKLNRNGGDRSGLERIGQDWNG